MKKNISINISGIIFHIEEDGYDQLKNYLDGITRYFASFEDSSEITSDIESRIAEIFLSKLTEDKQVITAEDVESLIATMGSVEDFQAIEDGTEAQSGQQSEEQKSSADTETEFEPPRQLRRDNRRKVLGGVCAGIAYYFNIDPIWIRLLTLILFLGSYGGLLIVYIILWIVIPSTDDIKEPKSMKKMFRNPDDKVIGGVASGVASYFGIDATTSRVLFVLLGIFGPGIIAYIILWIILPEANTITEKVQMQGEPVTLSNIESNVKQSLNVGEGEKESTLVKILLFPFRLIAAIITGIGKALGPLLLFLVEFVRVLTGVIMTLLGVVLIFSLLVTGGVLFGIITGGAFYEYSSGNINGIGEPFLMLLDSVPTFTVLVAIIVSIVPAIFLILLGVSVIAKKIVFNATVGWTLFGLLIAGIIFLSVNIPGIAYSYHENAHYEETRNFNIGEKTAVLNVDRQKGLEDYDVTTLFLRGHDSDEYKAVLEYSALGYSRTDAIENAKMVSYGISQEDSVITFDENIMFREDAEFKFQELDITLYVPYDRPFVMERNMRNILSYRALERWGYRRSQIQDSNTWLFTESGLECLSCERYDEGFERENRGTIFSRLVDVPQFAEIEINSPVSIVIRKGDEQRVEILGKEEYVEDIEANVTDYKLNIEFGDTNIRSNFTRSRDAVKVVIQTPSLSVIELNQSSKAEIRDFSEEAIEIRLNGASSAFAELNSSILNIILNGSSKLEIRGEAEQLFLEVNGSSEFEGYRLRTDKAKVVARGASSSELYVRDEITLDRDIVSSIRYRGPATEIIIDDEQ